MSSSTIFTVARKAGMVRHALAEALRLRKSRLYRLSAVETAFVDQKSRVEPSDDDIRRIAAAFRLAKEAQKQQPGLYHPSNEWIPIYEASFEEISSALLNEDISEIRRLYNSFWRNSCGRGLIGLPIDMSKYYPGERAGLVRKVLFLNDSVHRYLLWKSIVPIGTSTEVLAMPRIGNPYGLSIGVTQIFSGSEYLWHYAQTVAKLCVLKPARICEVGGGYGGFAYYYLRDNPESSYLDLDLPENLALTAYFLMASFPEQGFSLFGEPTGKRITLLPSFELRKIPSAEFDVLFNSYSFAEMSPETIGEFVSFSSRAVRSEGFVFHVNHRYNSLTSADNFGFEKEGFRLLSKEKAKWNDSRTKSSDEYEYVYEKTAKE
jgi:hypothetical protein